MTMPSLLAAFVCSFLIGLVWLCSPWFITLFLPKFTASVQSLQILMASFFFVAVCKMPQQLLPGPRINRQKHIVGAYFIGVVINVLLNFLFIVKARLGIEGAAWATLIANVVVCVLLFVLAHKFYLTGIEEPVIFYFELAIPFIWMAVLIFITETLWRSNPAKLFTLLPRMALYLTGFAPCLWYFNRKTKLVSLFLMCFRRVSKE